MHAGKKPFLSRNVQAAQQVLTPGGGEILLAHDGLVYLLARAFEFPGPQRLMLSG